MAFTPLFFRGLLSEPKGSVVASKAPITLCPRYWGQKTYMLMCSKGPAEHQTEHPIKMLRILLNISFYCQTTLSYYVVLV